MGIQYVTKLNRSQDIICTIRSYSSILDYKNILINIFTKIKLSSDMRCEILQNRTVQNAHYYNYKYASHYLIILTKSFYVFS